MSARETGWLPDHVFVGDKFESGLAFFADALGRITRFSREPADLAAAKPLKGQAALPGLVNAHAHPARRLLRGRTEPRTRAERDTPGSVRPLPRIAGEDLYDTARMAFLELLLSGVTTVGAWHLLPPADRVAPDVVETAWREILRAARDTGIRVALFSVADAGAVEPAFLRETDALREMVAREFPGDDAWLGLGVSGLAAVPPAFLKALAAYAHAQRYRLQIPVAESAVEVAAFVATHGRTPVAYLGELGLLDKRFTAVHAAHLSEDDVRLLGAARIAVCACPSAGRVHGFSVTPADQLLAAGVTVALGSGEGSSFELIEEARLLEYQLRVERRQHVVLPSDVAVQLLYAATTAGARTLGASSGALEVGRPADFFTVNVFDPALAGWEPDALLSSIVFALQRRAVREVWIGARPRVAGGRHLHQGPIVGRFIDLQRRLWSPGS